MYTLINKQIPIYNKFGFVSYIKEKNDIFYLVYNENDSIDEFSHSYNDLLIMNHSISKQLTNSEKLLILIDSSKSDIHNTIFKTLRSSEILTILYISIVNKYIKQKDVNTYSDFILKQYINKFNFDYKQNYFYLDFNNIFYKINMDTSKSLLKKEVLTPLILELQSQDLV